MQELTSTVTFIPFSGKFWNTVFLYLYFLLIITWFFQEGSFKHFLNRNWTRYLAFSIYIWRNSEFVSLYVRLRGVSLDIRKEYQGHLNTYENKGKYYENDTFLEVSAFRGTTQGSQSLYVWKNYYEKINIIHLSRLLFKLRNVDHFKLFKL